MKLEELLLIFFNDPNGEKAKKYRQWVASIE